MELVLQDTQEMHRNAMVSNILTLILYITAITLFDNLLFSCRFVYSDIDECSLDNTLCQQLCLNNDGGYTCACFNGFKLIEGTNQCEGNNILVYLRVLTICMNAYLFKFCVYVE